MNKLPKARNENIVVQTLDNETLIYDVKANKSFHLNATSSIVYLACDGQTSFADLKKRHQLTDDVIHLALDGLQAENLLAHAPDFVSPFAGMSRREAIKKVGLASIIALPAISALVAPTAANAASNCIHLGQTGCSPTMPCCLNEGFCFVDINGVGACLNGARLIL